MSPCTVKLNILKLQILLIFVTAMNLKIIENSEADPSGWSDSCVCVVSGEKQPRGGAVLTSLAQVSHAGIEA